MKIIYVLIVSCSLFLFTQCLESVSLSTVEVGTLNNYSFDDSGIPTFGALVQYMNYVSTPIIYTDDPHDYWQLPEETWKLKTGDCEDYCILFMYLVETRLNTRTQLVDIKNSYTGEFHVVVKIDNMYYELINNFQTPTLLSGWYVVWVAPYDEVMWMTYYYHNNIGKYY